MSIYQSVKESIAFIEANLCNDIGVLDVANAVSYSQFYFSREFAKLTHISIYDYIIRRKISESYKCLFESGPKILDLAVRFGFQSHEVYTRAFKKIFKESPSEAKVYKSLAIFEPIDESYLFYLHGLKVEIAERDVSDCCFEADSAVLSTAFSMPGPDETHDFLVILAKEHFLHSNGIISGSSNSAENQFLKVKLCNLRHKIRIHHPDSKYSFRYFINNFYDAGEMSSNYIWIKREQEYIDFIVPCMSSSQLSLKRSQD